MPILPAYYRRVRSLWRSVHYSPSAPLLLPQTITLYPTNQAVPRHRQSPNSSGQIPVGGELIAITYGGRTPNLRPRTHIRITRANPTSSKRQMNRQMSHLISERIGPPTCSTHTENAIQKEIINDAKKARLMAVMDHMAAYALQCKRPDGGSSAET